MSELITQAEVVALAFTDGEYISPEVIAKADIDAAVSKWIKPVVGQAMLLAVEDGKYAEFAEKHLKPTIAAFVRCLVQPRLNVVTGQAGLAVPVGSYHKAADEEARRGLLRSLMGRATALQIDMSEYLEANVEKFPEYDPRENVLNRCRCYGGFVQIC